MYELIFDIYSVSPFFSPIFFPYIYETDLVPIFAVSSNFPLEVLYNGNGCELFPQSLHGEVTRRYKKSISTKFKNKLLNTHICCA